MPQLRLSVWTVMLLIVLIITRVQKNRNMWEIVVLVSAIIQEQMKKGEVSLQQVVLV